MTRVLVLANEHVNQKMAGPSIRSFELSRALHDAGHTVTLGSPFVSDLERAQFDIVTYDESTLPAQVAVSDVVVLQGWVMERFPWIRDQPARVVVDLYDPFPLEVIVLFERYSMDKRWETHADAVRAVNDQVRRGDFFMCASEKQLDYWSGWLTAAGRFNPLTYASDPSLRELLDVVPFGLPSAPPVRARHAVRDTFAGIDAGDFVLLWGGGVYNWFDPVTLIRAVALASRAHPALRLVFMSTGHPNPDIQSRWTLADARRVADELGLTGRTVFFNDSWVEYEQRGDWLLDADVGVSTHFDHVETRFSFRTRILDYFWAGLPVISTEGDTLAEAIASKELGITVPPEDVEACASAIHRLSSDRVFRSDCAQRVRSHARSLTWSTVAEPLIRYCDGAQPAADRRGDTPASLRGEPGSPTHASTASAAVPSTPLHLLRRAYSRALRSARMRSE